MAQRTTVEVSEKWGQSWLNTCFMGIFYSHNRCKFRLVVILHQPHLCYSSQLLIRIDLVGQTPRFTCYNATNVTASRTSPRERQAWRGHLADPRIRKYGPSSHQQSTICICVASDPSVWQLPLTQISQLPRPAPSKIHRRWLCRAERCSWFL